MRSAPVGNASVLEDDVEVWIMRFRIGKPSAALRAAVLASGLGVAAVAMMPASAEAHSWCARANLNDAEMAICDYPFLRRLDRRMSRLYWSLYDEFPGLRYRLRHSQRHWLARRNACGYNPRCLRRKYRNRIRQLRYFGI